MQGVHCLWIWLFVPHDEISDITVNQRELYSDADAVEDTDILDAYFRGRYKHKLRD